MNLFNREPAVILGLVQSAIAVIIGFDVPISQEQFALLMALTSAIIALITRANVTPVRPPPPDDLPRSTP